MQTDAKGLRSAAGTLKQAVQRGWVDSSTGKLVDYILATVREDDGEAVTREWLGTVAKIEPGSLDREYRIRNGNKWIGVYFHLDGDVCMSTSDGMMLCGIPSELIPTTRRQFRALCEGLGIEVGDVPKLTG
mgnify:CR=1 FL=1